MIRLYIVLCLLLSACTATAQDVITVKQPATQTTEVLVLPAGYTVDKEWKEKVAIKTSKHTGGKYGPFQEQLEKLVAKAAKSGANILLVTAMHDRKQEGKYSITAQAYYSSDYESSKAKALETKEKKTDKEYAYITIYRPVYNQSFNDEIGCELIVNDTLTLLLKGNTKYILKTSHARVVKLTIKGRSMAQTVNINAVPGTSYYEKAYVNNPGSKKLINIGDAQVQLHGYVPYIEQPGIVQGELESSLVSLITVMKRL